MAHPLDSLALLRLQTWLSPAFPTGAYTWSHGLEQAVEDGLVGDRAALTAWVEGVLRFGTGHNEAILLAHAHRGFDGTASLDVAELAAALRPSRELAEEAASQGEAFLTGVATAWPDRRLSVWRGRLAALGIRPTLAVAVGTAGRAHGLPLAALACCYMHAFAANLVSAAVRLVPLGQSDGLRALAALEPAVQQVAEAGEGASLDAIGGACIAAELASMRHETQYTRLFRS